MNDILRQIEFCGIVPVVKIEDAEKALDIDALVERCALEHKRFKLYQN